MIFDPYREERDKFKEKVKKAFQDVRRNEKMRHFQQNINLNTRDTIAYILMLIGLILLFSEAAWYGATILGVIFGLYFGTEIHLFFRDYQLLIEREGLVRSLVFAGTLLAIFIASPFLLIGALVAVLIRQVLLQNP